MTDNGSGGPPPGWFPDPAGGGDLRWWDGSRWTEHTSLREPAGARPDPRKALDDERSIARWARIAILAYAGLTVVAAVLTREMMGDFRAVFNEMMLDPAAPPPAPEEMFNASLLGVSQLVSGIQLGAFVILLVWVHRAATAAARLGLPARRSPGWAVGSWFIPVVNLWWPCQSLRDLLPEGHDARQRIIVLWLMAIGGTLVAAFAFLFAMVADESLFILALVGYLVGAVAIAAGRSVIDDVLACHEALAEGTARA